MLTGITLQESIMMIIPEAWQSYDIMNRDTSAFLAFASSFR